MELQAVHFEGFVWCQHYTEARPGCSTVTVMDEAAFQEFQIVVNFVGVPAQAVQQIVESKEARVFIR